MNGYVWDNFFDNIKNKDFSNPKYNTRACERFFNYGEFAKYDLNNGNSFPKFNEDEHLIEGFTGFVENFEFDKYSWIGLSKGVISQKNKFPQDGDYGKGDYAYIQNGELRYLQKGKFKIDWDHGGLVNKFQQFINGPYSVIKKFSAWPSQLKARDFIDYENSFGNLDDEIDDSLPKEKIFELLVKQMKDSCDLTNAREPPLNDYNPKFGFWANDNVHVSIEHGPRISGIENSRLQFDLIMKKQTLRFGEIHRYMTGDYEDGTLECLTSKGPKYSFGHSEKNWLQKKEDGKNYNKIIRSPELLLDNNSLINFLKDAKIDWRFNNLPRIIQYLESEVYERLIDGW